MPNENIKYALSWVTKKYVWAKWAELNWIKQQNTVFFLFVRNDHHNQRKFTPNYTYNKKNQMMWKLLSQMQILSKENVNFTKGKCKEFNRFNNRKTFETQNTHFHFKSMLNHAIIMQNHANKNQNTSKIKKLNL